MWAKGNFCLCMSVLRFKKWGYPSKDKQYSIWIDSWRFSGEGHSWEIKSNACRAKVWHIQVTVGIYEGRSLNNAGLSHSQPAHFHDWTGSKPVVPDVMSLCSWWYSFGISWLFVFVCRQVFHSSPVWPICASLCATVSFFCSRRLARRKEKVGKSTPQSI